MSRFLFLIVLLSILMIAQRSPAPIVEQTENPTPATEQSTKPRHAKSNAASTEAENREKSSTQKAIAKPVAPPPPRSRFAGTWVGTMQTVPWGNWAIVLTVDANEATMTEKINDDKPEVRPARRNGEMLQARFPAGFTTITWSLTPNSDGTTADVRFEAFMNDFRAIFHRTADAPPVTKATSGAELPISKTPQGEIPTAKPVPERPGFVYNPFDPTSRIFIDVRGKPSGSKLVDPKSGKTFLVP